MSVSWAFSSGLWTLLISPHPAAVVLPWQPSSLTCALIIPMKVLPSFAVAEEAFEDGIGDGQHHGSGGCVAQPHGQE